MILNCFTQLCSGERIDYSENSAGENSIVFSSNLILTTKDSGYKCYACPKVASGSLSINVYCVSLEDCLLILKNSTGLVSLPRVDDLPHNIQYNGR